MGTLCHPVIAGWAGHRHPANTTLQRDAGRSPHATGHGHFQPVCGGWCGGTTCRCLEPAVRCVLGQASRLGMVILCMGHGQVGSYCGEPQPVWGCGCTMGLS